MAAFSSWEFLLSAPEAQGLAPRAIFEALQAIERSGKDIHSMLLIRHGKLVFEQYFAPYTRDTRHAMYSCSKTFTSMMIGIAQDKGLIKLGDRVTSFFPDVPVESPSDNLRSMTIRDLLMMGSGNAKDTFEYLLSAPDGDFVKAFLNRPVEYAPGTHFVYNTGATYMLSAILQRVTGRTLLSLAEEWLFPRLGIRGAKWDTCPRGTTMGGTGLHIRPRDMARMGLMLLNNGAFDGEQVVSSRYVREASQRHIDNRNPDDPNQNPNWASGYGYQMWRCAFDAFRADGLGGQYIVMMPSEDLVAVFTSALGADIGYPLDVLAQHILPGLSEDALPADPEGTAALAALSARLAQPASQLRPIEAAAFPWGRRIDFASNDMGLAYLTVEPSELRAHIAGGELLARLGWGAPAVYPENAFTFNPRVPAMPLAGVAGWDGGLCLRVNFVGQPMTLRLHFKIEGRHAQLHASNTMGGAIDLLGEVEE